MTDIQLKPVVIITGAAGAIGRAIACKLAHEGYDMLITDRREPSLHDCAAAARSEGAKVLALPIDIAKIKAPTILVQAALETFGRLDGLVNNAGITSQNSVDILDVSSASFDLCQAVNTRAVFFLTQEVGRHFAQQPTANSRFVVTITSSNATAISETRTEYCVSKAAASMATQCFAVRLAKLGVQVFEIRPGVIDTEMTAQRLDSYKQRIQQEMLTVLPRVGTAEEVARCVSTIAKGGLPYTVGQIINVDGGLISRRY